MTAFCSAIVPCSRAASLTASASACSTGWRVPAASIANKFTPGASRVGEHGSQGQPVARFLQGRTRVCGRVPFARTGDRMGFITRIISSSWTTGREIPIRRLYEMLEGQVAVLSSGRLTARGIVGPAGRPQAKRDVSPRPTELFALPQSPAAAVCREEQHSTKGDSTAPGCCGS